MAIVSHPTNKNYRDNFEETFGKKDEEVVEDQTETKLGTDVEPKTEVSE